jgi:hypothetical protein
MTTDEQRRPAGSLEERTVKKAMRVAMILAVLAAGLATTACQGGNLYNGVDFNGGWSGPSTQATGGITGYPF